MGTDYRVPSRSDEEIKQLAKRLLSFYGASNRHPVNVLKLLQNATIWTVFGVKRLTFEVVADGSLGVDDAVTRHEPGIVNIRALRSVRDRAFMGVGRDRMTFAHELGHGVMHEGPPMARATGARGLTDLRWIKPFESAEHQAKVFAPALLILDEVAETLPTVEEISAQLGVSEEAVEIYFRGARNAAIDHEALKESLGWHPNIWRLEGRSRGVRTI